MNNKWISVSSGRLPPSKKQVLVYYEDTLSGDSQVVVGCYIDSFMITLKEVSADIFHTDDWHDYRDGDNGKYIPKGWYETSTGGNKCLEIWQIVNANVVAWMELPGI